MMRKSKFALLVLPLLGGCMTAQAADSAATAEIATSTETVGEVDGTRPAPDSMRWLYGSGEAAAVYLQVFDSLADYVEDSVANGPITQSVIMGVPGEGAGKSELKSFSCAPGADGTAKTPAVVFDVDETVLMNMGYEYWQAATGEGYDSKVWDAWEKTGGGFVAAAPGAPTALNRIRAAGVETLFITNRLAKNAQSTQRAILGQKIDDPRRDEILLKGDDNTGSAKDLRRAKLAKDYCIIAMAGDNLGDFWDRFNDRDLSVQQRREMIASRYDYSRQYPWNKGWFILPNPVYGASIRGSVDEVFPDSYRWLPETGQDKDSPDE